MLISSGGGDPEDGVESDGEPGSGGECIFQMIVVICRWDYNGPCVMDTANP